MRILGIERENLNHYKLPSLAVLFSSCSFKCDEECGERVCQNSTLAQSEILEVRPEEIVETYLNNCISSSLVCAGLEPFDTFNDLYSLVEAFRAKTNDPIIIYTGYYEAEIFCELQTLKEFPNIIVKFGRYIPHQTPHHDDVLGVDLASNNQYAEQIS